MTWNPGRQSYLCDDCGRNKWSAVSRMADDTLRFLCGGCWKKRYLAKKGVKNAKV